jgi:GTP pyrophosphokinase
MVKHEYDFLNCDYTVEETEMYLREVAKSKYSDTNASQIFEALALAHHVHDTQVRCNNAPYIVHPMRVALMIVKFEKSITSKVFIAALLHDTLEKTCLTNDEIEHTFGRYVLKLVQTITRRHETKSLEDKMLAKRQNWEEVLQASHEVRAIKIFEDLDNMICWKVIPEGSPCIKKLPRWLEEAREMSLPLAHVTNMHAYNLMHQEYTQYVEQGFADQPITL